MSSEEPTSVGSLNFLGVHMMLKPEAGCFRRERLVVRLVDGRELSVLLVLCPTLCKASAHQRTDWELLGGGRAIRWDSLDLDLSVDGILQGFPERIPKPPAMSRHPASKTGRRAG